MPDEFWTLQTLPALTGFGGVAVGALITWLGLSKRIEADETLVTKKFEFDQKLARQKFDLDKGLAERKFAQEREQLIQKRRFELADTLLADAYRFGDIMRYTRTNVLFGSEGESRERNVDKSENLRRERDRYFVPIEPLHRDNEFISGFWAKQHAALAHFGPDAAKAFDLFFQSMTDVRTASQMLIQPNNDPDFIQQMRGDIWIGYAELRKNKDDEVGKKIEKGVLLFEKFCHPVLEWKGA